MNKNYVFVISGNREEYQWYLREKSDDDKKYIYVGHEDTLRGWRDVHGVFIGTWKSHSRIKEILRILSFINDKDIYKIIGLKNYNEVFDIDKRLSAEMPPVPHQPNWVPIESSTT